MITQKEKVFLAVEQTILEQLYNDVKNMLTTSQIKGFIATKIEKIEEQLNE